MPSAMAPKSTPVARVSSTVWLQAIPAFCRSSAPMALEIQESTPIPMAAKGPVISHIAEAVSPTAADACIPIRPTMAVSTYCAPVWSACSSTVGQDSIQTVRSIVFLSCICTGFPPFIRFLSRPFCAESAQEAFLRTRKDGWEGQEGNWDKMSGSLIRFTPL